MSKIAPCLWFDDQGEEAAKLYTSIFPNSKIGKVSRYGDKLKCPDHLSSTIDEL